MKVNTISSKYNGHSGRILYAADAIAVPVAEQFELGYWESRDQVISLPPGRGSAAVIEVASGQALLKRYLRGGVIARLNKSLYAFTGYSRSRAFREFELLQTMHGLGLPVPEPLAAYCEVVGVIAYRQALLTRMIADTETLAERQQKQPVAEMVWKSIGQTIKLFHQHGICHADLNANNILLNNQNQVFLVDFDKSRQRIASEDWQKANLQRLRRSLKKLFPGDNFPATGWGILQTSYMESK